MSIDHKNKILFIHIPRTGGSTVEKCFNMYRNANMLYGRKVINNKLYALQHLTFSEHIKLKYVSRMDEYFKFAFVRNPWDRLLSAYSFQCRNGKKFDFSTFISVSYEYIKEKRFLLSVNEYDTLKQKYGISLVHVIPQINFIRHKDYELDFVGKFENFKTDLKYILDLFNINCNIPNVNKSKHKHYSKYFTDKMIDMVNEMYKEEIELFDYYFFREE